MSAPVGVDRTVTVPGGTRLEVTELGQGEPLLLICGTSQSHRLWAPLLPALAARYRVISYDHRGIGNSDRGEGPISMASLAEQWDADLAHDALDRLEQITAPTLVIAGEQDLLTPPGQGRVVADRIPGARFELFTGPGSSHAALMERPQEFTDLVLGHVSKNPISA
jgi:pimeloyl-ACP methyl ester carboxylesterase